MGGKNDLEYLADGLSLRSRSEDVEMHIIIQTVTENSIPG